MCRRFLDGGYDVVAFDLDADVLARITALGAEAAGGPAEVSSRSDVAFCCLPTPAAVEQVVAGDDGLLAGAGARTIVDLSTNDPDVVRRLAERARAVGVDFLDSPVAGGVPKAEDGTLTLIVGGDEEAFERVRPLLERLGSSIHLLGGPGAGSVGKIANNIMSMCNMLAANEAFLVVKR